MRKRPGPDRIASIVRQIQAAEIIRRAWRHSDGSGMGDGRKGGDRNL